jgi:hypothetical protein
MATHDAESLADEVEVLKCLVEALLQLVILNVPEFKKNLVGWIEAYGTPGNPKTDRAKEKARKLIEELIPF